MNFALYQKLNLKQRQEYEWICQHESKHEYTKINDILLFMAGSVFILLLAVIILKLKPDTDISSFMYFARLFVQGGVIIVVLNLGLDIIYSFINNKNVTDWKVKNNLIKGRVKK